MTILQSKTTVTGARRVSKDDIERMCRNAGLLPVRRETIREHDVFVADGFNLTPDVTFKRFGIKPGEFPIGCHATMYWTAKGEDLVDIGVPLFFEPNHDPQFSRTLAATARVNTALREASGFLARRANNAKAH